MDEAVGGGVGGLGRGEGRGGTSGRGGWRMREWRKSWGGSLLLDVLGSAKTYPK